MSGEVFTQADGSLPHGPSAVSVPLSGADRALERRAGKGRNA